jgi:hypothetical protein
VSASRDASSSDLNRARELSRKLSAVAPGAPPPAAPAAPIAAPRFAAAQVKGVAPAPGAAAAAAPGATPLPGAAAPPPLRMPPPPTTTTFEGRTSWCRDALAAEAVFLLDERGLLVASAGSVQSAEAEGVGARLVFTFEQADAMKRGTDRTRSITIEFGSSFLTGWRFPLEGVTLTLGVVTAKALPAGAAAIVARAYAAGRKA